MQCTKLRVHHAPGVHISKAGCTTFGGVHPVCARFLSHLLVLYIGRVHGAISGCTVLSEVHPVSTQNKSLVSDTNMAVKHNSLCGTQEHEKYIFYNHFLRVDILLIFY